MRVPGVTELQNPKCMSLLRKTGSAEVSTGSVADIAFLLLTFFLMTTVINNERGLTLLLPQWSDEPITSVKHQRNIFAIQINSVNEFLIEGEPRTSLAGVTAEIKKFILNNGVDPLLSVKSGGGCRFFKNRSGNIATVIYCNVGCNSGRVL
jgi:biopolymer transport protein ExbD